MLGLAPKQAGPPLVWSDQYGVRIQRVGETPGSSRVKGLTLRTQRDGRLAAVVLMNEPSRVRRGPPRHSKEAA